MSDIGYIYYYIVCFGMAQVKRYLNFSEPKQTTWVTNNTPPVPLLGDRWHGTGGWHRWNLYRVIRKIKELCLHAVKNSGIL